MGSDVKLAVIGIERKTLFSVGYVAKKWFIFPYREKIEIPHYELRLQVIQDKNYFLLGDTLMVYWEGDLEVMTVVSKNGNELSLVGGRSTMYGLVDSYVNAYVVPKSFLKNSLNTK